MQEKNLVDVLLRSEDRDTSRGLEFVRERFARFGVSRYAVLVDRTTIPSDLPDLREFSCLGLFSFDANLEGFELAGETVGLVGMDGPLPLCDGWLVASTARAAGFALNKALLNTGSERQVVTRLYEGQVTKISGYVDVFSGETDTLVYVNHYLDRKYRITSPLDFRFTVRECDGTVRVAEQRILPPGGLTVIDIRRMGLGDFEGYLTLELEVENLQCRVQPFLHFWADYLSKAGLCRNHQSGWNPWAADTVFSRGYMPVERDLDLVCSFYNQGVKPARVFALLHFNLEGQEKSIERELDPIPPGQMSFQNVSENFRDISVERAKSAFYLLKSDQALHRPNYYVALSGTKQYINTSHQTGSDACHWAIPDDPYDARHLEMLERNNVEPWVIQFPILEEGFEIETYLGLLSSTICLLSEFRFIFRNEKGEVVFTKEERVDGTWPQFTDLRDYARRHGIKLNKGLFGLAPSQGAPRIPRRAITLLGFKHRKFPYITTAPASGLEDPNLPFYVGAHQAIPLQQQWEYSPLLTTDRFAPGTVTEDYDTLLIVTNCSLLRTYSKECEYRLEVIDPAGRLHCVYRKIRPQSYDVFWLSEILDEVGVDAGHRFFTLWEKSFDTLLISYHLLYRKKDHALACDDTFGGTLLSEPVIWDRAGELVEEQVPAEGSFILSSTRR